MPLSFNPNKKWGLGEAPLTRCPGDSIWVAISWIKPYLGSYLALVLSYP